MSLTALLANPPGSREGRSSSARDRLVIGLVNNMPDAALRATERQFCDLLAAAAGDRDVSLRFFALPEVPRAEAGRAHIAASYADISELWAGGISGLIVTGTEPRAANLRDEPYWAALTGLIDWAEGNTISTVWSCLGAHAAVLHLDDVERRPFGRKLSGVFECAGIADHRLLRGMPAKWRVPHSRYNDLPEAALVEVGYQLLARSPQAGVDLFARQRDSLFLFLQGHPEYDPGALYREYRRDVGRFLAGKRDDYPEMPVGSFAPGLVAAFAEFRDRAGRERSTPVDDFPAAAASELPHSWKKPAERFYANWLSYLVEALSMRPRRARVAV